MSTPAQATEYRLTFFDRHGPDGMLRLKAAAYAFIVLGLTVPLFGAVAAKLGIHEPGRVLAFVFVCSAGSAGAAFYSGLHFSNAVGESVKAVTVSGASTPYTEQFSFQQALVMKGKVDEALASFETIISERPANVDVRVRAAELYISKKRDFRRGADLLRQAQGIPSISPGEDVYVTNRLVDLFTGPLATPGRALVELRRLMHRYPDTPAASQAKAALSKLKRDQLAGGGERGQ